MGFLDFFTGGGPEKQRARHIQKLTNKHSQAEDRELAMHWLAEDGAPESVLGMLARFEMAIENRMKDTAEKEEVLGLLERLGEPTIAVARQHLKTCKVFAYPLRLVERVGGQPVALEVVRDLLSDELARQDFKPKRKTALLVKVADYVDETVLDAVSPFLEDFDEGVRYAAAEAILAQEGDEGREALIAALVNPDEESNRLRFRIVDGFHNRGWSVAGHEQAVAGCLPDGWTVQGDRLVRASG